MFNKEITLKKEENKQDKVLKTIKNTKYKIQNTK